MQTIIRALPIFIRRHKRAVRFTVAVALLLAWGGLKYAGFRFDQPPHAKQRSQAMFKRAVGICTSIGDVCSVDTHPTFTERRKACYPGDNTPLRMWKVGCTVDGHQVAMIFNDANGGLCYLVAERNHTAKPANTPIASIDTRQEAAEAGFQRLKAMKLLPQGSLVALNGIPALSRHGDVWEMTWNVKTTPGADPYTIRLALDRNAHMPLSVVDNGNITSH